jgi:hypothetical protein
LLRGNKIKRVIILLLLTILLSGCGFYNLSNFILPDDLEFIKVVEELDTPQRICNYMKDNFIYELHSLYAPDPYTLWKNKKGDCNDFSTFGVFIANYHNYEVYQIKICFNNYALYHEIAVYIENGKYNYSSNQTYRSIQANSFQEVMEDYDNWDYRYEVKNYKVYDYDMNELKEVI